MGDDGSDNQAEEISKDGRFHDQNLFHRGSGGFNGDGASGWDGDWHLQGKYNRLGGGSPIEQVTMSTKHTYVITGAIVVLVLGIRWPGINTGGVGGEGKIPIGKIGELWIGINFVEGLATTGYFSLNVFVSLYRRLCSMIALAGAFINAEFVAPLGCLFPQDQIAFPTTVI